MPPNYPSLPQHLEAHEEENVVTISRDDQGDEIILSTRELLDVVAAFRGKVIKILQYVFKVTESEGSSTITVIRAGIGTLLRLGIPHQGLDDQKIRFTPKTIELDRGNDGIGGCQIIYPLPDQGGAFSRPQL